MMSIKYRIAFLFALLSSIILSAAGLSVYYFSHRERGEAFRTRLRNRVWSTAKIAADVPGNNYSLISKLDTASVSSLYNKSIAVLTTANTPIYQYTDTPGNEIVLPAKIVDNLKVNDEYFFPYKGREAAVLHYISGRTNFIVAAAAKDVDGAAYLAQLKRLLFWVILTGIALSFLAGLFFAQTLIRPISRIMAEVKLISSKNLSQRINKGTVNDELYKLSETFNELLNRLQESFITQRRFISNASHELSTPLTSISSQLEVALQNERTAAEYKEVLLSVNEDVNDLQQLTKSLLDIAKTGSEGSIELSEVRIDEILLKVAADVQKANKQYKIMLHFEILPDDEQLLTVFGNSNLLFIALKNIVENGCKYADDHYAAVKTSCSNSRITISISSKGDIIADADIENIFQPFFRTESAQQKQGFGLGLTLTRRILSLHKGTIEVTSTPGTGTVFVVQLPNKTTVV